MSKINRKAFLKLGGLASIFGLGSFASASTKKKSNASRIPDINVAEFCKGKGIPPLYKSIKGDIFELENAGDVWHHEDGSLGLKGIKTEFDAFLEVGAYSLNEAIEMRNPSSVRGKRTGFGNPNGEFPPVNGTAIRFEKQGVKVGRKTRFSQGIDDRMSNGTIENICLYGNPERVEFQELGDGAAIWADLPSDQLTINDVNASCCKYGLLNTSYIDAFRIRSFHTGRVTHPLYFASKEEAGQFTAAWYGTVSDCCFADGDGPVVLQSSSQPWNFSNVLIVRQGRKETGVPACNIIWGVNGGRFDGGVIDSPGETFGLKDGNSSRGRSQIDADGMIISGSKNTISTIFKNAHGKGKANCHLMSGSNGNIIRSQFDGTKEGAVDLIIEKYCEDNLVHVVPGMTIIDKSNSTKYIGKEWAGSIKKE